MHFATHRLFPSTPSWVDLAPVILLTFVAAVQDVRERRIRNWLTLSMLITGLAQHAIYGGFASFGWSILGMFVGFILTFPLFAIGAVGGGDVKLLAALGAWVGAVPVFGVFVAEALVGMVLALLTALNSGQLLPLLRNSAYMAISAVHVKQVGVEHTAQTSRDYRVQGRPLPYAVPVLVGLVVVLALTV